MQCLKPSRYFLVFLGAMSGFGQVGATVPWTTYEAENMTISGGTVLGPGYFPNLVQTESSGRQCVQLSSAGSYVEFTAHAAANALVVRYSVPDTTNGTGDNYTLSLYDNGMLLEELPVTSMYSWVYGSYPFANNPSAGSPRNFFDEVRANGVAINPGDVIRLEKGPNDTASFYDIDLVDLENVPAALTAPSNSLSIISYGADDTGASDSTAALESCIAMAASEGRSVWMPSGNYLISSTINLPSNLTIQGAGMWYTTLVGNPALYGTPADRITFNGEGNNIHLANFAITGKLNYRNDSEPNDGLGGSYGTGSTISNLWVEHTKTGAWLVNSQGLLITGCRFRDTMADGCNINLGMQGCIITNCTCRGTGDDCFAAWPATYLPETYPPGSNIFTQCTGELNFLANGCGLYGGAANTVENCMFQDISYGCGVLISSTFAVGTNVFRGTTTAQNSEINRSGGFDPNFNAWRGAFQICLDLTSITNVSVNNMNITNSVSDGFSVISTASGVWLSNAIMANVSIPNYGLGPPGRNGLWAQNGTTGRLTVSNCSIAEYLDSSSTFTFIFVTNIQPPVQSMNFVQQPDNVQLGATITPTVTVEAFGTNGQVVSNAAITLALASGTGALAGTLTQSTDAGGIAHFNDLSVNMAGPKVLTATAAAGSAPPTNSSSFMVIGPVAALTFTTQPGAAFAGTPFGQQPVLQTVDQYGSPTTSGLPASLPGQITLTNADGSLLGTTFFNIGANFNDGLVAFGNLSINLPAANVQLVASASSVAPTSPVAGAVLWLDAGDPTTLTTNAGNVSAWKNKGAAAGSSGTNLWFTQPTSSLQPWLTNQINGKPVLTFSKNGEGYSAGCTFLANTNGFSYTNGGNQMTYFIVARQNEDSIGWQGPVSFSALGQTDGQGSAGVVLLADGSQGAPYPFGIQRNHPGTPMQADIAAPVVNTVFLWTFVDNAGSATLTLTNAAGLYESNSASIVNGISPYAYNITGVTVGGRLEPDPGNVDNGWDGDVAEVLVYNVALDAADQASVQSYLMNKWLVTNNAPGVASAFTLPFTVLPATPPSSSILGATVNNSGSVTLTYGTTAGYRYHLEDKTNLTSPPWAPVTGSMINATTNVATFTDTNSPPSPQRFYRIVSP